MAFMASIGVGEAAGAKQYAAVARCDAALAIYEAKVAALLTLQAAMAASTDLTSSGSSSGEHPLMSQSSH